MKTHRVIIYTSVRNVNYNFSTDEDTANRLVTGVLIGDPLSFRAGSAEVSLAAKAAVAIEVYEIPVEESR